MLKLEVLLVSFVLLLVSCGSRTLEESQFQYENGILVVDASNIEKVLSTFPTIIIEFYNPNCPHCVRFKPIYEEIQAKLVEFGYEFILAKADCLKNSELISLYDVRYFPFITHFAEGALTNTFSGSRSFKSMVPWILENLQLETTPELQEYLDQL